FRRCAAARRRACPGVVRAFAALGVGQMRARAQCGVAARVGGLRALFIPHRPGAAQTAGYAAAPQNEKASESEEQVAAHSNLSLQRAICSRTRSGAVPPKLARLAADCSTVNSARASSVIRGSMA